MRRAASGEPIEITVNGEAVARIAPLVSERSHWPTRSDLLAKLARIQADPGLADDLAKPDADPEELGPIR